MDENKNPDEFLNNENQIDEGLYDKILKENEELTFTPLEYKILLMLFSNQGKVITREQILDKIYDMSGNFVNDNTLTVYIKRIRSKVGEDIIHTIKGIGYRVD